MILYIDRQEVPDLEHISPNILRYCIEKAEKELHRYCCLNDYYLGRHRTPENSEPDEVQVTVNYAKYVVDIARGYYLGEAVKYDPNARSNTGASIDLAPLIDAYTVQQIGRIDNRIGKGIGVFGECLELCYASSEQIPMPKSAYIDPRSGILVCDSTVEHQKLFAIVWEKRERTNHQRYYFSTVYTDRTAQDYEAADLRTAVFAPVGDIRPHYFGAVPVIAYENNEERQGDFEQILPLIDAYNGLMSYRFTDKKKFVHAILAIYGATLDKDLMDDLPKLTALDGLPLDAKVEYIQKTFDESAVQVLADAAVREMHKMTLTVDMSDEQFAGNSSGQALKLKLLTMNLLVKNKMQNMEHGLKERFGLYVEWLSRANRMRPVSVNDVDIVFTLNLPINEAEVVQTVKDLKGVVDDQTLLGLLWFIHDPAEALENIKRQKAEAQAGYAATFGVQSEENDIPADDVTDEQ